MSTITPIFLPQIHADNLWAFNCISSVLIYVICGWPFYLHHYSSNSSFHIFTLKFNSNPFFYPRFFHVNVLFFLPQIHTDNLGHVYIFCVNLSYLYFNSINCVNKRPFQWKIFLRLQSISSVKPSYANTTFAGSVACTSLWNPIWWLICVI